MPDAAGAQLGMRVAFEELIPARGSRRAQPVTAAEPRRCCPCQRCRSRPYGPPLGASSCVPHPAVPSADAVSMRASSAEKTAPKSRRECRARSGLRHAPGRRAAPGPAAETSCRNGSIPLASLALRETSDAPGAEPPLCRGPVSPARVARSMFFLRTMSTHVEMLPVNSHPHIRPNAYRDQRRLCPWTDGGLNGLGSGRAPATIFTAAPLSSVLARLILTLA
jgi:hypothetical protein